MRGPKKKLNYFSPTPYDKLVKTLQVHAEKYNNIVSKSPNRPQTHTWN